MSIKTLPILVAAIAIAACGTTIKTAVDYDRAANFANYHTFSIMKGNSSGNPLLDQRAVADVEKALTLKGWTPVPEDGRAAVVVHAATKTNHNYETFYDNDWGGWNWRWGGESLATTFVTDYRVGTVVVDIFDAQSKRAIWHGFAKDALSENAKDNASITANAISKMFENFPPGPSLQ